MFNFFKKKKQTKEKETLNEVSTTLESTQETLEQINETPKTTNLTTTIEETFTPITQYQYKDEAVKRYTFLVKGTFVKERQKEIVKLVKELKDAEYFYESYEGLKPKEIKEDYFGHPIYEYGGCSIPKGKIEEENDNPYDKNALKAFISNLNGDYIHIGYVPKELCEEIREMKSKYEHYVAAGLEGGKYKMADFDENGDEKIKIYNDKEYGIELCVSFWEELPESMRDN
ncbi:hypothetical protein [Priestia megaterium]|uniref:hypothetical protein n=1 Tax=Priestia megaterium TaxID=1404 RepID=UPI003CC597A2